MEQTLNHTLSRDTIVAVSTAPGVGGIAVIRLSGDDAVTIVGKCWQGADLNKIVTHTAHLGKIYDNKGDVLDEVVLTYYKNPKSFTGEDVIEISCHGSRWIQREIVNLLVESGARPASPGEFTQRAFMNGRIDLAQAEGVIDLISSSSRAAHRLAMQQTTGRFSGYLNTLREQLIDLASLLELELDFSEEEVEFADREKLRSITNDALVTLRKLANSYATGKVLKEGLPVVIAGAPNAGKSTLLNALLDADKAIVSDIPGTTRDVIEDTAEIDGILFRFADTAGLRESSDAIERIGIEKAEERLRNAKIVLWAVDVTSQNLEDELGAVKVRIDALSEAKHILLLTKTDLIAGNDTCLQVSDLKCSDFEAVLKISAAKGVGIEKLKETMVKEATDDYNPESDVMLTNGRHYSAVLNGIAALERVWIALQPVSQSPETITQTDPESTYSSAGEEDPRCPTGLPQSETDLAPIIPNSGQACLPQSDNMGLSADLIAQDVREALHHLSLLTGTITTSDLLTTIFSRFCIGK